MPELWTPKKSVLEEDVNTEVARLTEAQNRLFGQPMGWQPNTTAFTGQPPDMQIEMPQYTPTRQLQPVRPQVVKPRMEDRQIDVPFWQRALQVFTAPFEWTQENIINPGLGLLADPFIPEVERGIGEDFWEWKKRSWENWDAPGVDLDVPWSDKPWRIDVKGVAELAPWLLIPGAGGIGSAFIRGAGVLGRLGPLAKVVGYGVKYSPWGVVERATGAVIGSGIGAISAGVGRVSGAASERLFGKITTEEVSPVIQKFTNFFKAEVGPRIKTRPELLKAQRAKATARMAQAEEAYRTNPTPENLEQLSKLRTTAMKGEVEFEQVPKQALEAFTPDEIIQLKMAAESKLSLYEAQRVQTLLDDLFTGIGEHPSGTIVNRADWRSLGKAYGLEFSRAVRNFTEKPPGMKDKILDVLNLPRAVLASWDFSATLRQGLVLGLLHPTKVPRAFGRQLKAFASEKLALDADDLLRKHPLFREFEDLGGYIAPLREVTRLASREESFMSKFAQNIPGIRRSERAYITYLNEMRMSAYETVSQTWRALGAKKKDLRGLAKFINAASGRGNIPTNLEKYSPVLSTILFSPRLQLSRLQLLKMLTSKNPYVRKEATRAAGRFLGTGVSLLTLLKFSGVSDIELDPRSSDFGKIKIGDTRLDIWTGYLQYTRFMAQMLTAERKSSYGNMNKSQRDEIAWRFLQSKSSPAFGLIVDMLRGEDYMGEKLFDDTTGAITQAGKRFMPLFIQDMLEASEQNGVNGMLTAAPAALGVGVLTYSNDFARAKDNVAKQEGFDTWEDVDPLTKRKLERTSPILQKAIIEFDRQVMGTQWGDWRIAGNAIEDVYRDSILQASDEYRVTGDGVIFREKVDAAANARRKGYDTRSRDDRFEEIANRLDTWDTPEAIVKLGPEQLAIKLFTDALYGDDMYDEFGNYMFDEAERRETFFVEKYGQETLDYIKEYMGAKWDAPQEYEQLKQAREVLKPYWRVMDEAIKMFGEPQTKWQQSRIDNVVQRMRKRMRRSNPEMDKYLAMFYDRQEIR